MSVQKDEIMSKPPEPVVDVKLLADEFQSYIAQNKFEHIDYGYANIEMYPNPNDEEYPEIKKFSAQWKALFDYADQVTEDDGTGFPEKQVHKFERLLKDAEGLVNSKAAFWAKLREEVIPIYEKSSEYEEWKKRWNSVTIFYDPVDLEVQSTKKTTNPETGVVTRKLVSRRVLPAGFVIRIN